jgi:hypothetical protein
MATIEQNLTSIAASLQSLVQLLQNQKAHVEPAPAPVAPVSPAPAPSAPVVAPVVVAPVPAAPAPEPVVVAPAPAAPAAAPGVPATIGELLTYVMNTYKTLGPDKGAGIQAIIQACGVSNINEINPSHFGYVFEQVERLKAA